MLHEDRQRAGSFGADAERYDRSRPSYPAELIDDLVGGRSLRVLDVGCGTGIAARLFAARGCAVLGLEPDGRMAALARSYGLVVEPGAIETWEPRARRFDLVTAAQAWHWVDPVQGPLRAAAALAPGGAIALFWNIGTLPPELKTALTEVYRRHAPGLDAHSVVLGNAGPGRFHVTAEALRASGHFPDPEVRTYPHDHLYTTASWLDQLPTHSDHSMLDPHRLRALLDDVGGEIDARGGRFVMHYDTWLVTATAR